MFNESRSQLAAASPPKWEPCHLTQIRKLFFVTLLVGIVLLTLIVYKASDDFQMRQALVYNSIVHGSITGMTRMSNNNLVKTGSEDDVVHHEFPGMPDPCGEPRRPTGVEDVLCMTPPTPLPSYKNPCWYDKSTLRCLPYFHLIGMAKSGTTDFFTRLFLHPDVIPNKGMWGKEIWYWSWRRYNRTTRQPKMVLSDFISYFKAAEIEKHVDSNGYHSFITGHGDPMDMYDRFSWPMTPQNDPDAEEPLWTTPFSVRHINTNVKLLVMLRDPGDRLYSHYFFSNLGKTAESFHDYVVATLETLKTCLHERSLRSCIYRPTHLQYHKSQFYTLYASMYSVHMREWLKAFPRSQMFVFRTEDYCMDVKTTLSNVFTFLNISIPDEDTLTRMESLPHSYVSRRKAAAGPMLNTTRKLLVELYRPFNIELAELLTDEKYLWKDKSFS